MRMIESLSDHLLIGSYVKAVELKLEDEFIALLKQELVKRRINLNSCETFALPHVS
jgi:hypothetical protein